MKIPDSYRDDERNIKRWHKTSKLRKCLNNIKEKKYILIGHRLETSYTRYNRLILQKY